MTQVCLYIYSIGGSIMLGEKRKDIISNRG